MVLLYWRQRSWPRSWEETFLPVRQSHCFLTSCRLLYLVGGGGGGGGGWGPGEREKERERKRERERDINKQEAVRRHTHTHTHTYLIILAVGDHDDASSLSPSFFHKSWIAPVAGNRLNLPGAVLVPVQHHHLVFHTQRAGDLLCPLSISPALFMKTAHTRPMDNLKNEQLKLAALIYRFSKERIVATP